MEQPLNELLPLAAKIARECDNIPGLPAAEIGTALGVSKQAAHKLAWAATSSLREALAAMGCSRLSPEAMRQLLVRLRLRPKTTRLKTQDEEFDLTTTHSRLQGR
jgi:hypothetical protein